MDPSGVAKLHARGIFEHPRVTTGHNRSVTFDTIVATSREKNGITCSLRYSLNNEEDVPELMSGAYDFDAKVVSFQPRTHIPSPVREDSEFHLMGEISVLRPLTNISEDFLLKRYSVARMDITGKVAEVNQDLTAFAMRIATPIPRGAANTHLDIRAFISPRTKWPFPSQWLPVRNSIINFVGNLVTMQEETAIVALDDITYLPHPGYFLSDAPPAKFPALKLDESD